eukprot:8400154-Heterocapsa_arctica.AAC.1
MEAVWGSSFWRCRINIACSPRSDGSSLSGVVLSLRATAAKKCAASALVSACSSARTRDLERLLVCSRLQESSSDSDSAAGESEDAEATRWRRKSKRAPAILTASIACD